MSAMNEWLTAKELADYVGMPYPNLWTYQKRGILPTPDLHLGNKPLWKRSTIEALTFPEFKKRIKVEEQANELVEEA